MNTVLTTPLHQQIHEYIRSKGIMFSWIADNINMGRPQLTRHLRGYIPLTEKLVTQINELLETDFKMQ